MSDVTEGQLEAPRPYKWAHGRVDRAETLTVIRVQYAKGEGVEGDPIRQAFAYFTPEGDKLWDHDTIGDDDA